MLMHLRHSLGKTPGDVAMSAGHQGTARQIAITGHVSVTMLHDSEFATLQCNCA